MTKLLSHRGQTEQTLKNKIKQCGVCCLKTVGLNSQRNTISRGSGKSFFKNFFLKQWIVPSKPERCRWGQSVSTLVTFSAIEVPNLKQDFSLGCGFKGDDLRVLDWLLFIRGKNRRISIPEETWAQRKPNHIEKMTRKLQDMLQWCQNFIYIYIYIRGLFNKRPSPSPSPSTLLVAC